MQTDYLSTDDYHVTKFYKMYLNIGKLCKYSQTWFFHASASISTS